MRLSAQSPRSEMQAFCISDRGLLRAHIAAYAGLPEPVLPDQLSDIVENEVGIALHQTVGDFEHFR